jgi:hypothetical protein
MIADGAPRVQWQTIAIGRGKKKGLPEAATSGRPDFDLQMGQRS